MIISEDTIRTIAAWLLAIATLVGAILALLGKLKKAWTYVLKPVFKKVKPVVKVIAALATLVIPNGLIIGFLLRRVATYYIEAGSLDFVITNTRVFVQLVAWQAGLVSLYSFLWAILIYPRIRAWFTRSRSNAPQ